MNTKEKQLSFSIIMPAYNRGFCIERAVNALLGQTYQDFELIIIDDGSTDGTENRIKERYKEYLDSGRIVYIRQPENKGVAAARNEGLKRAKNEWIAYADTDNIPLPDFLETFAAAAETHGNQCIYAQVRHSGSGAVFRELFKYASLLKGNLIDIGAFVHTRSVYERLGGFDESLTRLVDWDLILTYTKKYPPLFIDRIVLKYNDSNRFKRISNTEDYAGNAQRIWRKHAGLMLRLFNRRKSGDTRTVTVFGIPFSYRKNAHPLLYFMNESLPASAGQRTNAMTISLAWDITAKHHSSSFIISGFFPPRCSAGVFSATGINFCNALKVPAFCFPGDTKSRKLLICGAAGNTTLPFTDGTTLRICWTLTANRTKLSRPPNLRTSADGFFIRRKILNALPLLRKRSFTF